MSWLSDAFKKTNTRMTPGAAAVQNATTPGTRQNTGLSRVAPKTNYIPLSTVNPDRAAAEQAELARRNAEAAAQRQRMEQQKKMIQSQTTRTLELLRQQQMGQQGRGIGALRSNLAQRGLLDSGNLGAGVTGISNEMARIMGQGTMHAANNETDKLLALLRDENEMGFRRQEGERDRMAQRSLMELQNRMNKENQPSIFETIAGGVGQALPFFLMGR